MPETGRRLTNEVEILPEMIEAAMRELVRIDYRITDASEGAARVLEAALIAGGYKLLDAPEA